MVDADLNTAWISDLSPSVASRPVYENRAAVPLNAGFVAEMDAEVGLMMTRLGNELQNWVLVNLRRAKIGRVTFHCSTHV